jgi:hypothetical protein
MEQLKLVAASCASLAIPELEREANDWLKENSDKEIVNVSIISYPNEPDVGPQVGRMGWIIMIRYR